MNKIKASIVCAAALLLLCAGNVFSLDTASDFSLTDTSGKTVSLSSFRGTKPVLLFFWTTWCPYCIRQMKTLNEKYARMSAEGIEVIPINVGESEEKVLRFLSRNHINVPSLLDGYGTVADTYRLLGVPTYTLVDREGRVVLQSNEFPSKEYKSVLRVAVRKGAAVR